MPSCYLHCQL